MIVNNDSGDSMRHSIPDPAQKLMAASKGRGFWTREVHRWHWISSGISLAGLLLFAITGFTLNHAGDIAGAPIVAQREIAMSGAALAALRRDLPEGAKEPLPASARHALETGLGIDLRDTIGEWSEYEVFLAMPRPGGDATLTIDRASGAVEYRTTDYGWIAYINDLHKGRNTGTVWSWFIDLFALACLVFSITGLVLLQFHARSRPSTWPIVGFGLLLPVLLILLFVHR
jgi:uncharacterized protein